MIKHSKNGKEQVQIKCWKGDRFLNESREVTVEEPLEIFVDGKPAGTLMRTPGDELSLAAGFSLSEGLINSSSDFRTISYCINEDSNRINVFRNEADKLPISVSRTMTARSSCGICGQVIIDQLIENAEKITDKTVVTIDILKKLGKKLKDEQPLFKSTGGAHGALLADVNGNLLTVKEDVGRHNALDKAIGFLLMQEMIDRATIGVLSSRLSFEMVQKAIRAKIAILCGVSAPTSLAVKLAEKFNLTLIGFLRGEELNIYSGEYRISCN